MFKYQGCKREKTNNVWFSHTLIDRWLFAALKILVSIFIIDMFTLKSLKETLYSIFVYRAEKSTVMLPELYRERY